MVYAQTATGNFTEAEASYLRALAITEKARGPDHRDVISSLTKLAEYYSSTGVIKADVLGASSPQIRAKVVDIYRRAIGIAEKTGGERPAEVESLLGQFASFCTNHNLHPEATKIRERTLSMVEASKDNPVFYVQYAHARIRSLHRKVAAEVPELPAEADLALLSDDELTVVKLAAQFPRLVEGAAAAREPHRVAFYLHDLAAAFHAQ